RSLQAKLLRFLEDGSFSRVGGNEELRVNVRLLAATNRDIIQAIRENQFREDLYHRLNVVQFRPPPLRERVQDVCLLADHFLKQFCGSIGKPVMTLTKPAAAKLLSHHWPGNVRELRNVIERAVILSPGPQVQPQHLPDFELETKLRKGDGPAAPVPDSLDEALTSFEKQLILAALERNHFSINKTAERLKVTRHALRYRMQRLNINTGTTAEGDTDTLEK
ncbi:MAG: sigma 54-interacting transcriptional regulator, partial [Limisphaerales bacterium]